jgi:hypothetical protein
MKIITTLLTGLLASWATLAYAGESKRTAEYILATPLKFEGKNVDLDVSFVQPVNWKSPNTEIAFFHAMTMDRLDKKRGGSILVAIPAADAAKFAKRYGTDFDGRNEYDRLNGVLTAAPHIRNFRGGTWIIDMTGGKIAELVKNKQLVIEDNEGKEGEGKGERAP